ncbi:MAG: peptidylprolyl isomerase [Bacteroidetes bacterium]|nr:peptidylprolyl isomerase [Bacteroidota bacterium]MBL6944848.1 peptidylprolyl isomerase [Bacteroidales bacterium]
MNKIIIFINLVFLPQKHMIRPLMFLLGISLVSNAFSQQNEEFVIDQVVAVVGKSIILESDIQNQYLNYRMQGVITGSSEAIKCQIIEQILFQKLMVTQAEVDSIEVSDIQVEADLDRRLSGFIQQFGSQEKMEDYYGKSLAEIKKELYDIVYEQMLAQQVQSEIVSGIDVTPSEIRSYFRSIPQDSIPLIKTEYVIAEIVKNPPISIEEKLRVKEQLNEIRKRILDGSSFSTLAIMYSQDPGSSKKGGELGFYGRGQLYPEFEAVAFKLKEGEISNVLETEAGYHIIQMIERKGDYINVRHILLSPKVSPLDLVIAKNQLDSIALMIRADSITFTEAVEQFSEAENVNNGGIIINPYTMGTTFEADQLDPQVSFVIEKMNVDEISNPVPMKTEEQKDAYRILLLKKKTQPHKANMVDDYTRIREWALQDKQMKTVAKWIDDKAQNTYVRIIDEYSACDFDHNWGRE